MKRVVCFYIPEPLARGYKTNEFHKCCMKWKFISDSFLSHVKLAESQEKYCFIEFNLLPFLLRKMHQRRGVTYDVIDELRRFSLSKCLPALCHKLIYEIAIFHSINWETCDKLVSYGFYDKTLIIKINQISNKGWWNFFSAKFIRNCFVDSTLDKVSPHKKVTKTKISLLWKWA